MSGLESILSGEWALRIGWTLIHFLWQGALVALFFAIALRWLIPRNRSEVRYFAGCIAMTALLAMPVLTVCFIAPAAPGTEQTNRAFLRAPETPEWTAFQDALSYSAQAKALSRRNTLPSKYVPSDVLKTFSAMAPHPEVLPPKNSWDSLEELLVEGLIRPSLPYLLPIWLAGVTVLGLGNFRAWQYSVRLGRQDLLPTRPITIQMAQQLSNQLKLPRPPRIAESLDIDVPTVIGWLEPIVLLPASSISGLSYEQLKGLLAHELAHIHRHDYLVNLLQLVAESLLFYHPAVWWVSGVLRNEREKCCDDLAVTLCGRPTRYVRALTEIARLAHSSSRARLGMAINGGILTDRVHRLLGLPPATNDRRMQGPATLLVLAVMWTSLMSAIGAPVAAPQQYSPVDLIRPYNIPFLDQITIDGDGQDWGTNGFRVNRLSQTIGSVTASPEDFDAFFRLGWNKRGLLLLLEVRDDCFLEAEDASQLWKSDCVELFVAPHPGSQDYWQVVFSPGMDPMCPTPRVFRYDHRSDFMLNQMPIEIEFAVQPIAGGYRLEALLPWKNLGVERKLHGRAAFQIYVQDYDGAPDRKQLVWYPDNTTASFPLQMFQLNLAETASPPIHQGMEVRSADAFPGMPSTAMLLVDQTTGQPVADAEVKVVFNNRPLHTRTDRNGRALLALPSGSPDRFYLEACKAGYEETTYSRHRKHFTETVPSTLTLEMKPTVPIGGRVLDENRNPLPFARVELTSPDYSQERSFPFFCRVAVTDAQGYWRQEMAPEILNRLTMTVQKEGYQARRGLPLASQTEKGLPAWAALRKGTASIAMKKGYTLEGNVRDLRGTPIPYAVVSFRNSAGQRVLADTTADEKGYYHVSGLGADPITVQAYSSHHSEQTCTVKPGLSDQPVDFALSYYKRL